MYVLAYAICCTLGQKAVVRVGGNCLKYLKRGWKRKEGKGNKDFKKDGVGALKRGGWNPLTNYDIYVKHIYICKTSKIFVKIKNVLFC